MENFAKIMSMQSNEEFNPLKTLRDMADSATKTQASVMQGMARAQQETMNDLFGYAKSIPYFLNWAMYKTTIGSNGRIVIPEAERDALKLGEGDLIQVMVLPIARKSSTKEVKE